MEVQVPFGKRCLIKMVDCHACFFHRRSFRHVRSIASKSIKAQGAVPLICFRLRWLVVDPTISIVATTGQVTPSALRKALA